MLDYKAKRYNSLGNTGIIPFTFLHRTFVMKMFMLQ